MFVKYSIIAIISSNSARKTELVSFACLFIFSKESVWYSIESSLPLSGFNIINMDAISGIMTVKASLRSGSNNFYQVRILFWLLSFLDKQYILY